MAAYLPIGVVINVGRNNQAFVLGWGEAASSLAEQVEVLVRLCASLLWGRAGKHLGRQCKAHMVVILPALFTVRSTFNSGFFSDS